MSNRILTRADDNPGEILEDGELHKTGMWDEITIERSSAGAPGLVFIITRYENDQMYDQMCVTIPDGAAFLAPVNAWLNGNDPMPFLDAGGWRSSSGHVGVKSFSPRPGYNQNREDYS